MQPGSIVRFRAREWVLLPSDDNNIFQLRPLTGVTDDVIAVHRSLSTIIADTLPEERIRPSTYPVPSSDDLSDTASAYLLWQAARLTLREGASPFRCLGHISIRPRIYQFVPLLMALRLDPVRLFIADDVGVGKTIEALLVARELIDRGEVRRLAVLCPPYLCDQWEKELREKFNLEPVVIRSSTIGHLERHKPANLSIYQYYPFQVVSIDWVKSDRNKHQFLEFCPEMVIVDEAHGAAEASARNKSQQQRHQLLREIAHNKRRHLILITATPHSGIEAAFQSLLGLLNPDFREFVMGSLTEPQRVELARHFVQRTRKDIERDWEGEHCFPKRLSVDETYILSDAYRELLNRTYEFCSGIIRSGQKMEERKRRVRYWAALTLMRCVMSSPAAAISALRNRAEKLGPSEEDEADFSSTVLDSPNEVAHDEIPTPAIEQSEYRRLRRLVDIAQVLLHSEQDTKLGVCVKAVRELLQDGFYPIVWCRFVPTAEYVGEGLRSALGSNVQVTVITGRIGDEERRMMIDSIDPDRPRVLVATECLSEGINLQEKFTAVFHYDLPWNPNRLEQREGRVDRYGQTASCVKAVRFYGRNNPVDGAVIEVLLDKAREIHRALGTYVPVPEESETVMEAVLNSLFLRERKERYGHQLSLFEENEQLQKFHRRWNRDVERERINRSRFAQRALKPEEVQREVDATDSVLGDPDAVREFVLNATQRLGFIVKRDRRHPDVFLVDLSEQAIRTLPEAVRFALPERKKGEWRISFASPTPEGAEYVGRNHRFVVALARYLLEEALSKGKDSVASRCGVLRTRAVDVLTTTLLLRVRYMLKIPQRSPLLSEEVLVVGYRPFGVTKDPWLENKEALRLLAEAKPDANIAFSEKRELVEIVLGEIGKWEEDNPVQEMIRAKIDRRARELEESYKRIRKAVSLRIRELRVTPQFPPDLLGLLVLQPVVSQ